MTSCVLCGATSRDAAGNVNHEPPCPHFMRGPDAGGDPHEWGTLFEVEQTTRALGGGDLAVRLNVERAERDGVFWRLPEQAA